MLQATTNSKRKQQIYASVFFVLKYYANGTLHTERDIFDWKTTVKNVLNFGFYGLKIIGI